MIIAASFFWCWARGFFWGGNGVHSRWAFSFAGSSDPLSAGFSVTNMDVLPCELLFRICDFEWLCEHWSTCTNSRGYILVLRSSNRARGTRLRSERTVKGLTLQLVVTEHISTGCNISKSPTTRASKH